MSRTHLLQTNPELLTHRLHRRVQTQNPGKPRERSVDRERDKKQDRRRHRLRKKRGGATLTLAVAVSGDAPSLVATQAKGRPGPFWKRFGNNSRSRRSTLPASQHQSGVERSTLRGRVRSRGFRTTSAPSPRGLGYSARPPSRAVRWMKAVSFGDTIAKPDSGTEDWRLGTRLDLGKPNVCIPEARRCVDTFDPGPAQRISADPKKSADS